TTTTVTPPEQTAAGSIKHRLLPAPVPITATIGLVPCKTARITGSYKLRNSASSYILVRSHLWMS
ncbi:hypothetical protein BKA67DRAFT_504701, partial [Truncatella angustata]